MQCSKGSACLSAINVCAARIGTSFFWLPPPCGVGACCRYPLPTRRRRNWRGVLARSLKPTNCFASSQNDPQNFKCPEIALTLCVCRRSVRRSLGGANRICSMVNLRSFARVSSRKPLTGMRWGPAPSQTLTRISFHSKSENPRARETGASLVSAGS
jgi:hypothetical protein